MKVDLLIGANCLEAFKLSEVIPSHDKSPYWFRTALGWCVVGPMKAQQLDVISCNRVGVMKAGTQDSAEHHSGIEKKCEEFGVKEMLKKMYLIDFNEPSLKNDHPITGKLERISYEEKCFLRIMEKETCKIGNHCQPLPDEKMSLPNDRRAAEKKLKYLKKIFKRDPKFHEDYNKFMEQILSKDYAKES